jgi:regulator of nonsense transcripts 2
MSNDPQFSNIPLVSTFLKHFQRAYLGPSPLSQSQEIASTDADEENELVPATYRERFRKTFEDYFKNAGKVLVKGHTVGPVA